MWDDDTLVAMVLAWNNTLGDLLWDSNNKDLKYARAENRSGQTANRLCRDYRFVVHWLCAAGNQCDRIQLKTRMKGKALLILWCILNAIDLRYSCWLSRRFHPVVLPHPRAPKHQDACVPAACDPHTRLELTRVTGGLPRQWKTFSVCWFWPGES